jgi:hypothetical protein
MSPEELLARFPAVREAVAFVEFYELLPVLSDLVREGGMLGTSIGALTDSIGEELAEGNPPNAVQLLKAREQFRLPEFGAYLAGRLGLL